MESILKLPDLNFKFKAMLCRDYQSSILSALRIRYHTYLSELHKILKLRFLKVFVSLLPSTYLDFFYKINHCHLSSFNFVNIPLEKS